MVRIKIEDRMRLAVFVTHPVPYFSPLWRALSRTPGLEVVVHYFSDINVRGGLDRDFGVDVAWDVPLLDGHEHVFVSRERDVDRYHEVGVPDAAGLLEAGRFDAVLIMGYMHRFARQVVRAARAAGIRTLLRADFSDVVPFTGRSRLKSLVRDVYLRWFYGHVDAFCYTGEEGRLHLARRRIPADRMFFSPYSVDGTFFESQKQSLSREHCRAELGILDDQKVLLFSGKLIPRKAPLLLLEALRHVSRIDDVVVIFVGDGPLRRAVEDEAKRVLGPRCQMPGFVNQSQLGKYFAAADVFVLPSLYETWGLVVNEAMLFGLPVIVGSKVLSHRDLVIEGKTGFTFPNGDVAGLSERIETLLGDPSLVSRMGLAARERVALYDIESSAEGIRKALGLETQPMGAGPDPASVGHPRTSNLVAELREPS
jgi:glycosyltransferase involved in cell wall biosynthesis